eukprot:Clim_evm7s199 gene=Clim_evmTU7s199
MTIIVPEDATVCKSGLVYRVREDIDAACTVSIVFLEGDIGYLKLCGHYNRVPLNQLLIQRHTIRDRLHFWGYEAHVDFDEADFIHVRVPSLISQSYTLYCRPSFTDFVNVNVWLADAVAAMLSTNDSSEDPQLIMIKASLQIAEVLYGFRPDHAPWESRNQLYTKLFKVFRR